MNEAPMWRPLTTATPAADQQVEIDTPLAGTRVSLHRNALVHLLTGNDVPDALHDGLAEHGLLDQHDDKQWPHEDLALWQDHGWGLSLACYAWSRSVAYHDVGPNERAVRERALDSMVRERPCPTPPTQAPAAVSLPPIDPWPAPSLGDVIADRRSIGVFQPHPLGHQTLATLLHHGTSKLRECRRLATSADPRSLLVSVGAALDVYVLVLAVDELAPGAYRYEPDPSALAPTRLGDLREELREALAGQPDPTNAAATILLVADFDRYQWRYRHERALRNLYLECGRLMQPLILTATALGLRTGITPALRDQLIPSLLSLNDGNWQALHTLTVG